MPGMQSSLNHTGHEYCAISTYIGTRNGVLITDLSCINYTVAYRWTQPSLTEAILELNCYNDSDVCDSYLCKPSKDEVMFLSSVQIFNPVSPSFSGF